MVDIPSNPGMTPEQAFARLQNWYTTQQRLAELKTDEIVERKALAPYYFPQPQEGTNRLDIGGGFDLKMVHSLNRSVDEAALDNVKAAKAKKLKLNLDELFPVKRVLSVAEYRKLSDEQRAFVDTLLDITEGTPKLEIVPKADTEGQSRHAGTAEPRNKVEPPADPADIPEYVVTDDAESAEPGHYYTDGEGNWWLLNDEYDWDEVDEGLVATLEAVFAGDTAPPPPPPSKPKKRATRKRAARKGEGE